MTLYKRIAVKFGMQAIPKIKVTFTLASYMHIHDYGMQPQSISIIITVYL